MAVIYISTALKVNMFCKICAVKPTAQLLMTQKNKQQKKIYLSNKVILATEDDMTDIYVLANTDND